MSALIEASEARFTYHIVEPEAQGSGFLKLIGQLEAWSTDAINSMSSQVSRVLSVVSKREGHHKLLRLRFEVPVSAVWLRFLF